VIRVLVAEDSITARELLVEILRSDPTGLMVVGEAKNGLEAVEMTRRLRPDVVTMDIRMPVLDGYEATRQIMAEAPTPVVIVSGRDVLEVESSLEAVRAGALAVIEKPAGPGAADFEERARTLLENVRAMAGLKLVRRFPERPRTIAPAPRARAPGGTIGRIRAVAIATSTGGPAAVQAIFSGLPAGFPVPILVVQHITKGFVGGLATWLGRGSRIRVKVAEADEPMVPATAYLAPDERHLGVGPSGRILISSAAAVDGFRPSGTFLFDSAARALGAAALGVILTGMGRDGVEGLARLKACGGRVIAQDEASSVVFGMPAAAIEAGLADEVVALEEVARRFVELSGA
jgi:two-component system chemotaxis response regulator CheB